MAMAVQSRGIAISHNSQAPAVKASEIPLAGFIASHLREKLTRNTASHSPSQV
ncbi:hypothetical protein ALO77_101277 [Pseudomonas coronafaciens pv. garcae]|nr:hypothetical protein ALO77_101277 [Pseudomonas coronafaciens pv. garcae]RMS92433.1 hypothetical protein ALP57_101464 [Pseudomonas coronafaciens pv. oryzae]RMS94480.1 hypothetical protein ALP56_101289 [Pseudomonas coronafaciens pv. oryzae]RMV87065.1 hypothetical protein ALP02_101459 [Pseudomonas coronafaciens pv. garcae]